jgi:hypothetical protein
MSSWWPRAWASLRSLAATNRSARGATLLLVVARCAAEDDGDHRPICVTGLEEAEARRTTMTASPPAWRSATAGIINADEMATNNDMYSATSPITFTATYAQRAPRRRRVRKAH